MRCSVARLSLLSVLIAGSSAPALPTSAPADREPTVVVATHGKPSFVIALNATAESSVERRFGSGRVTIGFHANSARQWRLRGGGYFTVDGEFAERKYGVPARPGHVVDHILIDNETGKSIDPLFPGTPTFLGLHLGSTESDVNRVMGPPQLAKATAYERSCVEWRRGKGAVEFAVDIAFVDGKAELISVDASR